MLEKQEIEIIDENPEYCVFFPSIERTKLDMLNKRLSSVTAVISGALIYDGFMTDNSRSIVIGGSLATLSAIGLADRIADFRKKRQEKFAVDSSEAEVEIFTLV